MCYDLPVNAKEAFIGIFDMQGKMLKKINTSSGNNSVVLQGSTLDAGMYLYTLVVDGHEIDTKRMILTK
ncbi:MAG: T9SS type A sorting domain-containing protein [Bacteroidales bacterium]|nr:T9SS type A sorting domain-containing protein [Bacteroidales bacterium]